MTAKRRRADIIAWIGVLAVTIVYVLPLLWVALGAFKTEAEMFSPHLVIWPKRLYLDNFRHVLTNTPALWNSLIVGLCSTVLVLLLAIPAGYAFARYRLRRGQDIQLWILSTRMMPPIAVIIPLFIIFQKASLFDTRIGMILAYTSFNLPFAIWMLVAAYRQVPRELEEASLVDGGGLWQTLVRITIPLARSGVAVAAIFSFIWAWNDLIFALVLTASHAQTLPVALSQYTGQVNISWELMAAMSVIQAIPVLVLTFLIQRHIVVGMTLGGLKE